MAKLLANIADLDQTPHAASDLGLHCLQFTLGGLQTKIG